MRAPPTLIASLLVHTAVLGGLSLALMPVGVRERKVAEVSYLPSQPSPPQAATAPELEADTPPWLPAEPEISEQDILEPEEDFAVLVPTPKPQDLPDPEPPPEPERPAPASYLQRIVPPEPVPPEPATPSVTESESVPFVEAEALLTENRPPVYPTRAVRLGLEGTVVLEVLVSPRGEVTDIRVFDSSGHVVLDRAALMALRQWRFRPATDHDVPVPSRLLLPVVFRLQAPHQ